MMAEYLPAIQKLWSLTKAPVFHRHVANDIYFSQINDLEVVLRVTAGFARTAAEIRAELEWINYLKSNSVQVCETVLSQNKNEIETVKVDSSLFHVVVFKKIPGQRIADNTLNENQVCLWATQLAKMHLLAKSYQPKNEKRKIWIEDSTFLIAAASLDELAEKIKDETIRVIDWLKSKEINQSDFGLVHGDLHTGNFFFNENTMTIFDFDDACYHWFLYDLSIPILTLMHDYEKPEHRAQGYAFAKLFLKTYFAIHSPPLNWKEDFIQFCKYRCLIVHAWLISIQKERNLTPDMKKNFQKAIEFESKYAFSTDIEILLRQC
jgi:amicoumacin kinase